MIPSSLNDPKYYLQNFHQVLIWLKSRYADLLSVEEATFIQEFEQVPVASQALLVRMVMRKGTLFRHSKLVYAEVGEVAEAVEPLAARGWVAMQPELSLAQLGALLTKQELQQAFAPWLAATNQRKPELLAQLAPQFPDCRDLAGWCPQLQDSVLQLTIMPWCDRFRLMFFGNLRQDWSEFVLAELGIYRYETVAFTQESRAFRVRTDVDAYLSLHHCREALELGADPREVLAALPPVQSDNLWLRARRDKLLFQLGQQLERSAALEVALAAYADSQYPGARLRQLRVLERLQRFSDALALAQEAETKPESAAEQQALARLLPRLHRQLGLPKPAPARKPSIQRLALSLPRPDDGRSVEWVVRDYLHRDDAPAFYVENGLILSLFGLLCWDTLFAPLPGAFFHPFQAGPADLHRPDFYPRRAALFEADLALLDDGGYPARIRQRYADKHGLVSPYVFWDLLSPDLLELALHCLPAMHLKLWFRRLLSDLKANRAGMPDLIQFWPEQRGDHTADRYCMVEVKGPGDSLQDNQWRWLDFCAPHRMPVTVCYVQWCADENADADSQPAVAADAPRRQSLSDSTGESDR